MSAASSTDVLVVGAGVVGAATAYELSRRGLRVTVVDRGPGVGHGCSYANAGLLSPSHVEPLTTPANIRAGLRHLLRTDGPFRITPRLGTGRWLARFLLESGGQRARRLTETMQELARASVQEHARYAAAGIDSGFRRTGSLDVYLTPQQLARRRQQAARDGEQHLSAEEARALVPGLGEISGAVLHSGDAVCDTLAFARECLRAAVANGADVRWNTDVEELTLAGGCVTGARTSTGRIVAGDVVVAAGVWAGRLTAPLGVRLPLLGGKGYVVDIPHQQHPTVPLTIKEAKVVVTPYSDRVRVCGTMDLGDTSARIVPSRVRAIQRAATASVPFLDTSRPVQVWAGQRPCTADGIPIVGSLSRYPQLHLATGHGMWGLVLAPATARAVAVRVADGHDDAAWAAFSPDRFTQAA